MNCISIPLAVARVIGRATAAPRFPRHRVGVRQATASTALGARSVARRATAAALVCVAGVLPALPSGSPVPIGAATPQAVPAIASPALTAAPFFALDVASFSTSGAESWPSGGGSAILLAGDVGGAPAGDTRGGGGFGGGHPNASGDAVGVPAPGGAALLGIGLAVLWWARQRRRRRA